MRKSVHRKRLAALRLAARPHTPVTMIPCPQRFLHPRPADRADRPVRGADGLHPHRHRSVSAGAAHHRAANSARPIAAIEHSLAAYLPGPVHRPGRWSVRCPTASGGAGRSWSGWCFISWAPPAAPWPGPAHPGHRPLCRGGGRLRRHGAGARLCARSVSARAGGAHLRPDAADPVGVAAVRALCRRLAAAADRLAQPVLAAGRRGAADLGLLSGAAAGKPSRLGPAAASRCMC